MSGAAGTRRRQGKGSTPAPRRSTRGNADFIPLEEAAALASADDMITEKMYDLYTPDSPPYAFPRAIPNSPATVPHFQASIEAVRADQTLFKNELRRM